MEVSDCHVNMVEVEVEVQAAWWLHIPQSFTSSSRRSGSSAPSLNVTLHLLPTAGVWHRTRSSATCAGCQLAVHADICCRGAGGARSVSTTTHRRTNNVPNDLLPSGWSASPAHMKSLRVWQRAAADGDAELELNERK